MARKSWVKPLLVTLWILGPALAVALMLWFGVRSEPINAPKAPRSTSPAKAPQD